ncbi:MAG: prolipoprotein diacylglyceryl transferase family protein [Janthinobacterium lividum]
MALLYSPPTTHGHFYYEAAQLGAFAVYVGLLLAQGYRRGYPWRQWLPLVAAATLALLLGCQLVFLPPTEWLNWLRGDAAVAQALATGPRSVLGGAAASLLAVLAVHRALGFRGGAVLDAFAGPLCWALVVQCVGCVLVGCCWGEVASSGVAFNYAPGTLPYLAQQAQGLLSAGAAHALPVVPTQLYHLLLCAGVGGLLHGLRRRAAAWPGGSRYLLAVGLLCLGRTLIEGWRDPAGEPLLAGPLVGWSRWQLQELLLLESLALLVGWAWLRWRGTVAAPAPVAPSGGSIWVALGLLLATARLGSSLLTAPEVLTLQALLLLVVLAEAWALLPALSRGLPRLAGLPLSAVLAGVLLLVMAQAPAPQAPPATTEQGPTKVTTLSLGMLGNSHDAEEGILDDHSGCSGSTPMRLHQRVRAGGAEIAITTRSEGYGSPVTRTIGGGLWLGQQQIEAHMLPSPRTNRPGPDTTLRYTLFDAHIYKQRTSGYGWLTIGYRVGLHLGDLGHYSYFDGNNTASALSILPELMVSLGNPRLLYGQADFGYGAENALGACTSRLALGSGLGQANGSQLLAGLAHSAHTSNQNMGFVSATLRLPSGTGLSALSLEPYFAPDFARHNLFSLKMNYRLNR